uniref:Chlorophyll a-b binding proteinic n=1 Tax=Rhizophora mucronata TaxID=61149 RepID=A0A2P2LQR3_RHIMU
MDIHSRLVIHKCVKISTLVLHQFTSSHTPSVKMKENTPMASQFTRLFSLSRYKVCGISPSIVVDGISKVVSQILQWSLTSHNGLNKESEHREHGQSAILDLLHLQLSKSLWVISQSQWVKAATRVEWVCDLSEGPTRNTVTLHSSHQDNLTSPDGQDALSMDQAGVAQVVKATLAEDLGSGLEPDSLTELDSITSQQLREDTAEGSKHGPSAVDHLELPIPGKGLWVSREPSGVPAVVTGELTSQVGWGLTREWPQVLDTVGAIPWAARGNWLDGFSHGDAAIAH